MFDITQELEAQNWPAARRLIELRLPEAKVEDRQNLSYNLIVCCINQNDFVAAQRYYIAFKKYFNEIEREALKKEFPKSKKTEKPKETKQTGTQITEDGQIKRLEIFTSDTTMDDVIGLPKVKKELKKQVINVIRNPEIFRKYGAKMGGGAILFGPPGTGKTLLARAIAGDTKSRMLLVRVPEILNKYQGSSEKNVSAIFNQARETPPTIIFFDELDGVAQDRSATGDIGFGASIKSIISTMLSEIDGIAKNSDGLFVLGASNRPWDIDDAFKRSGRFSKMIYVPPPNVRDRIMLFKYYLRRTPIAKIDFLKLGLASFGMTPADIATICDDACKTKANDAIERQWNRTTPITTYDILKELKAKGKPMLFEWYAKTLEEFRKMPAEERNQYPALKKDIIFWNKNANGSWRSQQLLSKIV